VFTLKKTKKTKAKTQNK